MPIELESDPKVIILPWLKFEGFYQVKTKTKDKNASLVTITKKKRQ